jgi:predicted 3-demethylubiquinone-9 3-methyltransferase (glyoxalase superfamily)
MKSITPFLWFDGKAEEAARFYVETFPRSKLGAISRYGPGTPGKEGSVMTVAFTLCGLDFVALNGGPQYRFNESISFVVSCETQEEIDACWDRLCSGGGQPVECGWLKDRYGVAWQVVPAGLGELISGDPARSQRVMAKLLTMKKLDLRVLQQAAKG